MKSGFMMAIDDFDVEIMEDVVSIGDMSAIEAGSDLVRRGVMNFIEAARWVEKQNTIHEGE